jgi:hypothetical protein
MEQQDIDRKIKWYIVGIVVCALCWLGLLVTAIVIDLKGLIGGAFGFFGDSLSKPIDNRGRRERNRAHRTSFIRLTIRVKEMKPNERRLLVDDDDDGFY